MEKPSWTTLAVATAAAIGLGVGIYFLSKDEVIALDLKGKHKVENLRIILNDLHLEYTCIYTRYYNLILKLKEQGKFDPRMSSQIEADLKADLAEKNKQVIASREAQRDDFKEGLDPTSLELWVSKFKDDPEVKKLA